MKRRLIAIAKWLIFPVVSLVVAGAAPIQSTLAGYNRRAFWLYLAYAVLYGGYHLIKIVFRKGEGKTPLAPRLLAVVVIVVMIPIAAFVLYTALKN